MNAWDNLSLTEKSDMIRVAVENGITTLPEIRKAYNEFAEGGGVDTINTYETDGYKPSENIKSRIAHYEGKAMTGARDPISGKWGKNSSFEAEARGFYKALPVSIREQVLSNPELADSLYSYSYNVGAGNFKKRVVPALERYYAGIGSVKDIEDSMWATHDNKLRGLQRRRAEEKAGVRNALMGEAMPLLYTEQAIPEFTPFNPQAFSAFMGVDGNYEDYIAPQVVDVEEPLVQAAMESAYSPEQIEREERAQGLRNLGLAMSIMRGGQSPAESSSLWNTVGLLTGSQYKNGGKIHIKPENRGKFTALKKRTGHSATWFKEHGTPAQKKMATFALNSRHWKHGLGGNLFSGEDESTQQMQNGLNLYRRTNNLGETEYIYQETPDSEEILLTPTNKRFSDDPTNWDYKDASGRKYSPRMTTTYNPGEIREDTRGPLERMVDNYFGELKYQVNNNVPISGEYTMPAIAAAPFLAWAGEAAYPYVSAALANPYVDAGLTSAFAGHGLNHAINEGINGWGDAAMTALEVAPLGRLAKPMWNAGKEAVYNIADRYIFMPHQNSFTRGIGITDAGLQDAVNTGVFRGNPRGTEYTAKQFTKGDKWNRDHFKDIMNETGIDDIASKFQSRTLSEEEFNAIKEASKKYVTSRMKLVQDNSGKLGFRTIEIPADPLEPYPNYASYKDDIAKTIDEVEKMPYRIQSGEVKVNNELTPTVNGLPHGKPIEERFGPNSDYVADGHPMSYWYPDGRNPVTQGHAYAKSNYGVRVNNPEDYQPFMHELHLHPSFFRSPKFSDPNVEIFGKGPLGLTVKLDKETLQPVWKRDLSNMFRRGETIRTPQITAENAASITPEQWTAAQDAAIARGDMTEAQRLRDLHFQVSAPNTVASVNGQPLQLYHGTDATFNAFDISKYGNTDGGTFGRGIYTTPVKTYAELYGENNMPLYMKLDNPRDYRNSSIGDLIAEKFAFGDDFATGNGIDGVIGRPSWKGFKGLEEYVSHNPKNIKSSLPITYDDNGVRIPLGERDNFNINDIRYGLLPFGIGLTGYGLWQRN